MDHGVWRIGSLFTAGNQFPTMQHVEGGTVGGNRLHEIYFARLPDEDRKRKATKAPRALESAGVWGIVRRVGATSWKNHSVHVGIQIPKQEQQHYPH